MSEIIKIKTNEKFPERLQSIIEDANEFILKYLSHTYGNKNDFSNHYNEIVKLFENIEYTLAVDVSRGNAAYNKDNNSVTIYETLSRKFDDISDKDYLLNLATLIHELSHAISHLMPKILMIRYEEGIADLLSDRVLEFVRENELLKNIDKNCLELMPYKETAYTDAGTIIRTFEILSKAKGKDFMWDYLFEDNNKKPNETPVFDTIKIGTNEEIASVLLSIEIMLKNTSYLTKKEEKILKELLKEINISNVPSILIQNNKLLQEIIYEVIKELDIEDKSEMLKMFPNLPESFFENYEVLLTRLSFLIDDTVENYGDDINQTRNKINEVINLFLEDVKFNEIKEYPFQSSKHNIMISFLLKTLKYNKCFFEYDFELGTMIPILINYDIISNGKTLEESDQDIKDVLSTFGFMEDEPHALELWTTIRKQNSILKNKSKDEIYNELKKIMTINVSNSIYFENLKRLYDNDKISESDFINETFKMFLITKKDELNYPTSLVTKFIKTIVKKHNKNVSSINPQFINSCIPNFQKMVELLELPFNFDITSYVLTASLKDDSSINQFFQLFKNQDLHIKSVSQMNEVLMQVLLDSMAPLSTDELSKIIDSVNSDNYVINNKSLRTQRYNGYAYIIDDNSILKSIHANLRVTIKNLYVSGDLSIKKEMASDNKWFEYIIKGYDPISVENKKELFIYELQSLPNNEKTDSLISKINSDEKFNFYFGNLKEALSDNSYPSPLEHKQNLDKLENTPLLYWMYYKELLPTYKMELFSFYYLNRSFDNYIMFKDILPEISEKWLEEFEAQKKLLEIGKFKKEQAYDCKSFLSDFSDKLSGNKPSWDEATSRFIIEKTLPIVAEAIIEMSSKEKIDSFELNTLKNIITQLNLIKQYYNIEMISSIIDSINMIDTDEKSKKLNK